MPPAQQSPPGARATRGRCGPRAACQVHLGPGGGHSHHLHIRTLPQINSQRKTTGKELPFPLKAALKRLPGFNSLDCNPPQEFSPKDPALCPPKTLHRMLVSVSTTIAQKGGAGAVHRLLREPQSKGPQDETISCITNVLVFYQCENILQSLLA